MLKLKNPVESSKTYKDKFCKAINGNDFLTMIQSLNEILETKVCIIYKYFMGFPKFIFSFAKHLQMSYDPVAIDLFMDVWHVIFILSRRYYIYILCIPQTL